MSVFLLQVSFKLAEQLLDEIAHAFICECILHTDNKLIKEI